MKRLFTILTLFLVCTLLQAKNYVVIAGISDYQEGERDLWFAANDAMVMKQLYLNNGDAYVITLTNSDATADKIKIAMRQAFRKAKAEDNIVFIFAGHGFQGGFACYNSYIFYEEVVNAMKTSKAKKKMVFVNACYSGNARYTSERTDKHFNEQIMFFLSSRSGQVSWERSDMKNSFFIAYLERGMRGAADSNRDKRITAVELFNYVSTEVNKRSNDQMEKLDQHPVMWGNFDDNMIVIDWSKKKKNRK